MRFENGSLLGEIKYWLYWRPIYPRLMRFMHRHGWHHVKRIGPLMPGGGYLSKCDWCGLCDVSEAACPSAGRSGDCTSLVSE